MVIEYLDYTFTDADIKDGNIYVENSIVAESLAADKFSFTVINRMDQPGDALESLTDVLESSGGEMLVSSRVDISDVTDFIYGTPVLFYHGSNLFGKFYVENVTRISKYQYRFECCSAVGMLLNIKHYGGVYHNETFSDLVDDILGTAGITEYQIASDVANVAVSGWLGVEPCRDALKQVCFATGCSILKNSDGSLRFTYNQDAGVTEIASDRLYIGGKVDYLTPATKVVMIEHDYYVTSLDVESELYSDDTTVTDKIVTFDAPYHDLTTTGTLTIASYGDNYAIVSGSGTLTGKAYTHTTKEISVETGSDSAEYEIRVEDATLISASNSYYAALRVANFYGSSKLVSYGLKLEESQRNYTGQLVSFRDPFGDERTGYIKSMDITLSGILKANCKISTDFSPGPFGANFVDQLILWSGDGTGDADRNMVSINGLTGTFRPADYNLQGERVRVVVFSSSHGGQGGANGTAAYTDSDTSGWATPGYGGQGGSGGTGIYYYSVDMVLSETSYTISLGEGGTAGIIGGGEGGGISASTFGSLSSHNGNYTEGGYYNIVTRRLYGSAGQNGYTGGMGGSTIGERYYESRYAPSARASSGGSVAGFSGGLGGANWQYYPINSNKAYWVAGGNGGGACYGANGQAGTDSTGEGSFGRGGNGASVPSTHFPKQSILGIGGLGGHGGGGGGISGGYRQEGRTRWYYYGGTHGTGGTGTPGGKGSDGFILILSPKEVE